MIRVQYDFFELSLWVGVSIILSRYEDQQDKGTPLTMQSFRLHHMSRTGSLRKTSQSFLDPDESFKLAALNSVSRGIK